jgi:hypothetical protein
MCPKAWKDHVWGTVPWLWPAILHYSDNEIQVNEHGWKKALKITIAKMYEPGITGSTLDLVTHLVLRATH